MPLHSAGLLLYRRKAKAVEVFLIHMGGPVWAKRGDHAWSIPKGLVQEGEEPEDAARREFTEETGARTPATLRALGRFRQNSGKDLSVWSGEGDFDPEKLVSSHFEMIWPPHSGRRQSFPEADKGGWFGKDEAWRKIVKGQRPVLEAFFGLQL